MANEVAKHDENRESTMLSVDEVNAEIRRVLSLNNRMLVNSLDSPLAIAMGDMASTSYVNKFGRNEDIDTGAAEDVWDGGGIYVPPTTNRLHTIVSTSVQDAGTVVSSGTVSNGGGLTQLIDDTATFITDGVAVGDVMLNDSTQDHSHVDAVVSETELTLHSMHHNDPNVNGDSYRIVTSAGTGAMVAHIKLGLQIDGTELSEFIVLNGTTGVSTSSEYYRINRMHIHGAGSTSSNVGTITATAATDATVTAQINPTNGQTLMAFFTIPQGKTGYITNYYVTMNRKTDATADISLRSSLWGDYNDGDIITHNISVSRGGGMATKNFNPYLMMSQGTDFWLRVDSVSANDTDISAGFDVILVSN